MMIKRQSGFTLIELAIVMVIIGLLLGGVLKGQELMTQAKVKNVINDLNGISAAVYAYQDRYRALPGDDAGATRWTGAVAGGGDGAIAGKYNAQVAKPAAANESSLFWDHLRRAGFVAGSGGLAPTNAANGIVGVQTGDANGSTVLAATADTASTGFSGLVICSSNLPDKIAVAIDTQLDDGIPNTGQVRAMKQSTSNPDIAANAATTYVEDGSNQYTLCKSL